MSTTHRQTTSSGAGASSAAPSKYSFSRCGSEGAFRVAWWVSGAADRRGEVKMRYSLDKLRVADGWIAATDGRRLHAYRGDALQLPEGFYRIARRTTNYIVVELCHEGDANIFPNWHEIVPTSYAAMAQIGDAAVASMALARRGIFVEPAYLADLFASETVSRWTVKVQADPGAGPVVFDGGAGFFAMVMPRVVDYDVAWRECSDQSDSDRLGGDVAGESAEDQVQAEQQRKENDNGDTMCNPVI